MVWCHGRVTVVEGFDKNFSLNSFKQNFVLRPLLYYKLVTINKLIKYSSCLISLHVKCNNMSFAGEDIKKMLLRNVLDNWKFGKLGKC